MRDFRAGDAIPIPPEPVAEAQVVEGWPAEGEPVVSILCHTYNHRDIIGNALNGFLMQRTSFPFEVIVHDDCSTDGTREVVLDYHARYPRILRPILQERNIYSQGLKPLSCTLPATRGRYIAFCEGDDFWIDPDKLQRQVDALDARPGIDMCYHRAIRWVVPRPERNGLFSSDQGDKDIDVVTARRVLLGGGSFCATSSLMFRRSAIAELPPWFADAPVGDVYLQLLGARRGGAIVLREIMSVCRKDIEGSWTQRMRKPEAMFEHLRRSAETYAAAKAWYGPGLEREFDERIAHCHTRMAKVALRMGRYGAAATFGLQAARRSMRPLVRTVRRAISRRLSG